ncbi:MAG: UDP-N-acetylmuramoyl-tripeptide--D-alanyl-D-alanine ligase [Chitinophagaceae bacterium]|nr:UDP-N-acetylmuramoyl-tripeptide--D-alanyl-D-alanine ligase [Chitinophagaceae bacterium]
MTTIEQLYSIYKEYPSVQTDTRKLQPGDIFFALKGPSFDGNQFAQHALDAGAAYAVVNDSTYVTGNRTLLVDDALIALQRLAKFHRKQFTIPFIAITGSNGKTTTKELIYTVLAKRYTTYTTQGNLNNHIGVPLTILSVRPDAEIAVIEMGANHQKEIEGYCDYTMPTHGLITNCGKAHLEGFGGVEGVRKGKGELFDYLRAHDGTALIMNDYDYLTEMSKGIHVVFKYGTSKGDIVGTSIRSEPFLEVAVKGNEVLSLVETKLVGDYNLPNVLAAIAVGKFFNVDDADIKNAIEAYNPSNSRSQLIRIDDNEIILDAYNANPSSMKAAIENFAKLAATDKVLMLGAMAELGIESIEEHKGIVNLIGKYQWKDVVLVGGDFEKLTHPYHYFKNSIAAKEWLAAQDFHHTTLLVKGSRSVGMEKVLS